MKKYNGTFSFKSIKAYLVKYKAKLMEHILSLLAEVPVYTG